MENQHYQLHHGVLELHQDVTRQYDKVHWIDQTAKERKDLSYSCSEI